jgi:hypothetical protein
MMTLTKEPRNTSGAYGDLFRLGSDTTGLDVSYFDTQREDLAPPDAGTPAQFLEENFVQPGQRIGAHGAIDETNGTAGPLRTESADEALTHQIQALT